MHQHCWRLGLRPRPRWGSLHTTDEIHDTQKSSHQMLPFQSKNAAKSLAAGARPRPHGGRSHLPLMKSMTHYSESLHQMLPFMSEMHQNHCRLGLRPRPRWGTYMPFMKSMTHYSESLHQMLPFMSKMQQNRWRLGLRPRPRWGNLHAIDEIHDTLLRIIAPDASIYVQNAPKSWAARGAFSASPGPLAVRGWDGDLVTTLVGLDFDMCPLACERCPWLFCDWLGAWTCSIVQFYLCGICLMMLLKLLPNTALGCVAIHQLACPFTAFMFSCSSGTQCSTPGR